MHKNMNVITEGSLKLLSLTGKTDDSMTATKKKMFTKIKRCHPVVIYLAILWYIGQTYLSIQNTVVKNTIPLASERIILLTLVKVPFIILNNVMYIQKKIE